jgi:hypothetical protein
MSNCLAKSKAWSHVQIAKRNPYLISFMINYAIKGYIVGLASATALNAQQFKGRPSKASVNFFNKRILGANIVALDAIMFQLGVLYSITKPIAFGNIKGPFQNLP